MFTVIFEVTPKADRFDAYLALATSLRPKIEAIDGFLANERYRSRRHPEKLVSLSDWRDEKALVRWRTLGEHHAAQERGRADILADYHLRVGETIGDGGQRFDETETGFAKIVTLTEFSGDDAVAPPPGALASESFENIARPGELVLVAGWRDRDQAATWRPHPVARHRLVRIIRDYGMRDRREAPQYYPPVRP